MRRRHEESSPALAVLLSRAAVGKRQMTSAKSLSLRGSIAKRPMVVVHWTLETEETDYNP